MLYGMINERRNCLDVTDNCFENILFLHMFSNKSIASSALILAFIVISDYRPIDWRYRCYK